MEKILQIKDLDQYGFEGYIIITNKQTIKLGITKQQICCERWGYFWSNDNIDDFIGAIIYDVKITDTSLNEIKLKNICSINSDIMFVNIETNRGILQFVAYNDHTGFYGHKVCVESKQLIHSENL